VRLRPDRRWTRRRDRRDGNAARARHRHRDVRIDPHNDSDRDQIGQLIAWDGSSVTPPRTRPSPWRPSSRAGFWTGSRRSTRSGLSSPWCKSGFDGRCTAARPRPAAVVRSNLRYSVSRPSRGASPVRCDADCTTGC
jgi:hypothetical protein